MRILIYVNWACFERSPRACRKEKKIVEGQFFCNFSRHASKKVIHRDKNEWGRGVVVSWRILEAIISSIHCLFMLHQNLHQGYCKTRMWSGRRVLNYGCLTGITALKHSASTLLVKLIQRCWPWIGMLVFKHLWRTIVRWGDGLIGMHITNGRISLSYNKVRLNVPFKIAA